MPKTYKEFNKTNIKSVRSEIDAKLAELQELGLNIELGNIKFSEGSFSAKIECTLVNGDDIYAEEFKRHFVFHHFHSKIGKKFTFDNEKYIFRGFKPRARVRKAIIENSKGDLYRIEFLDIKNELL